MELMKNGHTIRTMDDWLRTGRKGEAPMSAPAPGVLLPRAQVFQPN